MATGSRAVRVHTHLEEPISMLLNKRIVSRLQSNSYSITIDVMCSSKPLGSSSIQLSFIHLPSISLLLSLECVRPRTDLPRPVPAVPRPSSLRPRQEGEAKRRVR